ncbi:hypothetical protein HAX54_025316 [Datura stramonium]|uniref:Uncharacterized protein n=1 Tax=Datura stramonium TaxID=4076 RepID=A0ABS8UZJ6_DATST|nr:hypothetical protein [Datura stramonium]
MRREKKTACLKSTHNPTRAILEISQWSRDEECVFCQLGVRPVKKDETYLVVFLLCWLCAFMLYYEEGDFIRLKTFKIETMMETKWKISLVMPTHYALENGPSNPLMVAFSGEGIARYFNKEEAKKRIHKGDNIAWNSSMLNNSEPSNFVDGKSSGSHEDCCWRKVRLHLEKSGDMDLAVFKILGNIDSSSRTLTILIKESNSVGVLQRGGSWEIGDFVSGSNPVKSSFISKGKRQLLFLTMEQGEREDRKVVQKIEKFRSPLEAIEKEVEEAKLGALTVGTEFDACYDADLLNANDLTNLEQKK